MSGDPSDTAWRAVIQLLPDVYVLAEGAKMPRILLYFPALIAATESFRENE